MRRWQEWSLCAVTATKAEQLRHAPHRRRPRPTQAFFMAPCTVLVCSPPSLPSAQPPTCMPMDIGLRRLGTHHRLMEARLGCTGRREANRARLHPHTSPHPDPVHAGVAGKDRGRRSMRSSCQPCLAPPWLPAEAVSRHDAPRMRHPPTPSRASIAQSKATPARPQETVPATCPDPGTGRTPAPPQCRLCWLCASCCLRAGEGRSHSRGEAGQIIREQGGMRTQPPAS